jgi:hypothetical protein
VWHASAAARDGHPADKDQLRLRALEALDGVGDPALGQWEDWSGYAYHVKRRLTPAEQQRIGDPVDVRGTPEADRRHNAVRKFLPAHLKDWRE